MQFPATRICVHKCTSVDSTLLSKTANKCDYACAAGSRAKALPTITGTLPYKASLVHSFLGCLFRTDEKPLLPIP
ncbi:hypothetical protein E5288_WYG008985 [Bos mutus]|uniref:Uncharacterized protein n=1 Tax=Bos mutus TaxID=72004 RepID=A0A6B0QZ76_9CETA|nr:hypothetical protein [Bos mutus]